MQVLNVPKYFEQFYPKFEYILVDLAKYTDIELIAMGKTYLTSTLLLFKHQKDKQFVLNFYKEIFIFVESYKNRDRTERFVKTLILYIF